jgi:hypothetical protein
MGRFEKLNDDMQMLADKILADQDLCKLIHYPDNNPLDQPDVNPEIIRDERLLLFTPKIPLAEEQGTYVIVLPTNIALVPNSGNQFIRCLLVFDIYSHQNIRNVYYKDKQQNDKKGDRVILIMNKIEEIMKNIGFSIGDSELNGARIISNSNATFSGYEISYKDFDFKSRIK